MARYLRIRALSGNTRPGGNKQTMTRKFLVGLMLAAFLLPTGVFAMEGDAYLSQDDLRVLQPSFDAFLSEMADLLIGRGLLPEGDRESWILYQRGDFMQNGGFGTIYVIYTPGFLALADESVTMRRLRADTPVGVLMLETLHRYVQSLSPLPGLPLDVELRNAEGETLPCRFRWITSAGSLVLWDGSMDEIVNVGASYINDGRAMYWVAEPVEGIEETLTLELLAADEDETLAVLTLTMLAGLDFWSPEALK